MTSRAPDPRLAVVGDTGGGMSGEMEPALNSNPCHARDSGDKPNGAEI
jgi:hypothetical protein